MRILMCCADPGVPLLGNQGSSVHLRSLAEALAALGHEVRLVVSNAQGPETLALPVVSVPAGRLWPGLHGWLERLRGRAGRHDGPVSVKGRAGDHDDPEAPASATPPERPQLADVPEQMVSQPGSASRKPPERPQPADQPKSVSWKLRVYYQRLPSFVNACEEFFVHPFLFGRAVAREIRTFKPHAIYERYSLGQFGAALVAGSVPHLLELNASLARERGGARGSLPRWGAWWGRFVEKRLWRAPSRVFCVSERLGALARESGVSPEAICVTPNGVDVRAFSPELPKGTLRRLLHTGEDELLVGWLGALSNGRGAEEFVRIMALALPEIPRARAVVLGGGPLCGELQNLAASLNIADRITFLGPVDHGLAAHLLVDLAVAVACYPRQSSSEAFYFSPMKLAEYLACGLAVVAGRAGEMARIVEDGVNGLLVEPGDLAGFARAVCDLCAKKDRREALGLAARESALAGPTWEKTAQKVERQIGQVIGESKRAKS